MEFYLYDNNILYTYAPHKGYKGIDLTPVKDNTGILIHDHDKSFYAYGSKHQSCLSHILRYLQSSIDNEPNITWSKDMKSLLQLMIHTVKHNELTDELIEDYIKSALKEDKKVNKRSVIMYFNGFIKVKSISVLDVSVMQIATIAVSSSWRKLLT